MTHFVDTKCYRVIDEFGLSGRLLVAARDRIYDDFLRLMQPAPDDRIIDVGVSDVINSGANVIERRYRHQERITACGLGDGTAFRSAFPKVDYVRIAPSGRLPFADSAFAIATANAVLEHVGSELQRSFVSELVRVGRRVFITVPNRYFPVEHHTALPFIHYFDATFRLGCSLTGNVEWTQPDNLILMTRSRLVNIAQVVGRPFKTGYTGLRFGPLSSNLYLVF